VYIKDIQIRSEFYCMGSFFFPFVQLNKLDVERMFITGQEVQKISCNMPIKLILGEYIKIMLSN